MTGSAIAIPLLGATGASAASGTTWDQVAECESGGSWSEDSGNGYYGGLQLSQENWEKYGGLDYAPSADQASRSQQIAVAEKVLDDQGISVWPTCGLLAGLGKDDGAAGVDTGTADGGSSDKGGSSDSSASPESPESSGLSDSSEASGSSKSSESASPSESSSPSGTPSNTGTDTGKKGKSPESGASTGSATGEAGQGESPSATADESAAPVNSAQAVGSSNLVDTGALGTGRHRGGSADEDATEAASTGRHATSAGAADASYTVRVGDTLGSIADSLDLQGGWRALYAENREAIGADPSSIVPGQTLELGGETVEK